MSMLQQLFTASKFPAILTSPAQLSRTAHTDLHLVPHLSYLPNLQRAQINAAKTPATATAKTPSARTPCDIAALVSLSFCAAFPVDCGQVHPADEEITVTVVVP